ncbi:MAG: XRE family transcriptional regulator [Planctomycetes bacterium]|nr:XRE family transcriptional regulator [Planctomycetota bacterium]MBU1517756.1 XRE family transcriptional regulator [Planctomycetota bacterium]MBU2458388.1 XRE family transcriptional regulator [Planctomycetota bacterium]MBU2596395.1 XRE family transcriptional regulator [Planctomycetota bacterium]
MDIGERLKIAREAIGYTQTEAAQKAGLSGAPAISELESNKREPKFSQLSKLAEIYHKSMEFFFSENISAEPILLWRSSPDNETDRKKVEAEFKELCEQYHKLEVLTDELREVRLPEPDCKNSNEFQFRDAYSLAHKTAREFSLGDIPSESLKRVLEEKYYIKIFHLPFEGSAVSTIDQFGCAILLNSSESTKEWRRNYDLAHELFHLLTWDVFRKKVGDCVPSDMEEKLANAFASALLMPEELLRDKIRQYSNDKGQISFDRLNDIAREFDVSLEALLLRLHFVYHKEESETAKYIEIVKNIRTPRQSAAPGKFPERYCALAERALREGKLSLLQFAKFMDISYKKAQEYLTEDEGFMDEKISVVNA